MQPNSKDFAGHAWAEPPRPGEAGVVLLLVLWVLVLLSTLILSLAQEWRTELQLTGNSLAGHQCHRLAEAGIYYALGKLVATRRGEEEASQGAPTFSPDDWHPDQSLRELELPESRIEIRIGDEAGKINLNKANDKILASLFAVLGYQDNQIPYLVDAILDWRDPASQARSFGGKSNYYLGLNPPYSAKGGKFEVVEELAYYFAPTGWKEEQY